MAETSGMAELERLEKAREVLLRALERKAEDPVVLDVREVSSFADTFVVLTGRSDRQVCAIADAVEAGLRSAGERALGVEGYREGRWVLLDFTDLIVHVFQREVREHYDLERLWSDAPRIDLGIAVDTETTGTSP
jgi:ribosome-associated protein